MIRKANRINSFWEISGLNLLMQLWPCRYTDITKVSMDLEKKLSEFKKKVEINKRSLEDFCVLILSATD